MNLIDYVMQHTEIGAPNTGADVIYFNVVLKNEPTVVELRRLCMAHIRTLTPCTLFDGQPHHFTEIGIWLGDQITGLRLMGLGHLLGLWNIISPRTMYQVDMPLSEALPAADAGMLGIQVAQ